MEPRQIKKLSEILLGVGIILAVIGLAAMYLMEDNMPGAVILIVGCTSAIISLPTFMLLAAYTTFQKKD